MKQKISDVGVVIGRFQVDSLHDGHRALIGQVISNHKKVIILVGVSHALASKRNPLDFPAREKMLRGAFPNAMILPLSDRMTDEAWSKEIDDIVGSVCPVNSVTLYGGRDSFIPHYHGRYSKQILDVGASVSGTQVRNQVGKEALDSKDFRAGIIYSTQNRYPVVFQAVDIVVIRQRKDLLVGKKYGESTWRFIGGFVDPGDDSLETAAKRELHEEAGLTLEDDLTYLGSFMTNDWRYRSEEDKLMTALFIAKHSFGEPEAGDDIKTVAWLPIKNLDKNMFYEGHKILLERVLKYLKKGEKNEKR